MFIESKFDLNSSTASLNDNFYVGEGVVFYHHKVMHTNVLAADRKSEKTCRIADIGMFTI